MKEPGIKTMALSQIILLIVGIFAIAYALGSGLGFVSAANPGDEFTYVSGEYTITYVIIDAMKVQQKNTNIYILKDTSIPCSSKWFWDVDNDGVWGSTEQTKYDATQAVCMLPAFVTAMAGASAPETETTTSNGGKLLKTAGQVADATGAAKEAISNLQAPTSNTDTPSEIVEADPSDSDAGAVEESEEETGGIPTGTGWLSKIFNLVPKGMSWLFGKMAGGVNVANAVNTGFVIGHVVQGAFVAWGIYAGLGALKTWALENGISEGVFEAARTGISLGWWAGEFSSSIVASFGGGSVSLFGATLTAVQFGGLIGIVTAGVVFLISFRKTDTVTVQFECEAWQAPIGGSDCNKCNNGLFACSEYQCKSLGTGCELINEGDETLCVYVGEGDRTPPVMNLFEEALEEGYEYTDISSGVAGARIDNVASENGCAPTGASVSFGLELNEAARCKADLVRKQNFEDMTFDFGGSSSYKFNHTETVTFPSIDALRQEGIDIPEGTEYEWYVKCIDVSGNENVGDFVFQFCLDPLPDNEEPEIVGTSLLNGMPVALGQDSTYLEIYVDEVVTGCKWDTQAGVNYESMANTMNCERGNEIADTNSRGEYTCTTTITGIQDGKENDFYFKCTDVAGNTNTDDYPFKIIGTKSLGISSASPNEELIEGSTDSVLVELKVETAEGANDGKAFCYYGTTGDINDYTMFSETDSHISTHKLSLPDGNYKYYIRCVDIAGNADSTEIEFEVQVDNEAPFIARAYRSGDDLILVTNEEASCVYSTESCDYSLENGISISSSDDLKHEITWSTANTLYVKCQDKYENQPIAGECSVIVKPFDFF